MLSPEVVHGHTMSHEQFSKYVPRMFHPIAHRLPHAAVYRPPVHSLSTVGLSVNDNRPTRPETPSPSVDPQADRDDGLVVLRVAGGVVSYCTVRIVFIPWWKWLVV